MLRKHSVHFCLCMLLTPQYLNQTYSNCLLVRVPHLSCLKKVKIVVSTVSQQISLSGKTLFCSLSQSGFITKSRKNIWISLGFFYRKKIHIISFLCTHHKHPWEINLLVWNCRLLDDSADSKCSQKLNVLCQCEHAAFKLLYLFTKTSRCTDPSHNSSICYLIGPDLTAADWLKTLH